MAPVVKIRRGPNVPILVTAFIGGVKEGLLGARCNLSASIRHGSWFQQSRLTHEEIILLTYDIVCR